MSIDSQETPDKNTEPHYLRLREAAQMFSISVSKLHEFISNGRLKTINLREPHQNRGIRLVEKSVMVEFLEKHAEGGDQSTN